MSTLIDVITDNDGKVLMLNNKALIYVLPNEYTRVSYLESDGTAYINTNFIPTTEDLKHVLIFGIGNNQTGQRYICGTGIQEGRSGNLRINTNALDGLFINKSSAKNILNRAPVLTVDTKYKIIMNLYNNATNTVTLNGMSVVNTTVTGTIDSSRPMHLFALNASYIPTGVRIYSSKLDQGGKCEYHLIPARRVSDQVLGMYDVIRKMFLINAGTGTFITDNNNLSLGSTNANIVERCTYDIIDGGYGVVVSATSTYGRASFVFLNTVQNEKNYKIEFDAEAVDGYKMIYFHNAAFNPGDGWDPVYGTMSVAAGGHFTKTITSSSNTLWIGIYASATTTTGKITLKNITVTPIA